MWQKPALHQTCVGKPLAKISLLFLPFWVNTNDFSGGTHFVGKLEVMRKWWKEINSWDRNYFQGKWLVYSPGWIHYVAVSIEWVGDCFIVYFHFYLNYSTNLSRHLACLSLPKPPTYVQESIVVISRASHSLKDFINKSLHLWFADISINFILCAWCVGIVLKEMSLSQWVPWCKHCAQCLHFK